MSDLKKSMVSVVVPIFNEAEGLNVFHNQIVEILKNLENYTYELIYCDDGSTDNTFETISTWHKNNTKIKYLQLSRNFGKENALSAGIAASRGDAVIMLDGDGQHPVNLIPNFIRSWEDGAKVVVGIRVGNEGEGLFKQIGSKLFYSIFNSLTKQKLIPGSTDYRLIDKVVRNEFLKLTESDRITRGLIDWLGFKRAYIHFHASARVNGTASYGKNKLFKLAANSFVSLTPTPLYLFGYLGVIITGISFILGITVFIEQILLNDPWNWNFTGSAMLGILILFLVGIILSSQGILSLYISHIQSQTRGRPLYIIDHDSSLGIEAKDSDS